ncbi:hypothetical protein FACS1894187_21860 [Synergistales bacterium]|nr:hypothetical protein FACS1894187_21860 [Synergistales bacterium]
MSHKAIALTGVISNAQKKKILGGVTRSALCAHFVLIGHLGKYIGDEYRSEITSQEILDSAFEIMDSNICKTTD